MKTRILPFFFILVLAFSSCTDSSPDDLIDSQPIDEITYTSTVKSIINNNCIQCHGTTPTNGASNSLTTYENVRDAVLNNDLIDRISRSEGTSGAMPLGGPRLPQASIDIIVQWNDEGLVE
jgi:mono/diheme cytochrome c family protein